MVEYSTNLTPPANAPIMQAPGFLSYWLDLPGPTIGCQASVLTEDPTISLHVFRRGGRDDLGAYLFRYKGTQIGFLTHDLQDVWQVHAKPRDEDLDEAVPEKSNTGGFVSGTMKICCINILCGNPLPRRFARLPKAWSSSD